MSRPLSESLIEILLDLELDNPEPAERWISFQDFDPPFRVTDLRALAGKRLIEIEFPPGDRENWRFRFTEKGRSFLRSADGAR